MQIIYMRRRNNHSEDAGGKHEHPLSREIGNQDKERAAAAHDQADHDIADDPDFAAPGPNEDLDEGESARLGEENTDLI
jgi:hypothetical protein